MIKTKQLLHALVLERHRSFRKAAQAVCLSHPAFSRSISNLEQFLGMKLFDRLPSGVEPTVHGRVLLKKAIEIIDSIEELEREIRLLDGLESGEMSVSMGAFSAEISGLRAVGRLVEKYPALRVKVEKRDIKDLSRAILERTVDIGLTETSTVEDDDRLDMETIGNHKVLFFCRPEHPLAGRARLGVADLQPYPMATTILPERVTPFFPGKLLPSDIEDWYLPDIEVEDMSSARDIVAESDACGAACPAMFEEDLRKGRFVALPIWEEWMRVHYGFIARRGRTLSPAAMEFKREVLKVEADVAVRNEELVVKVLNGAGVRP
jgi:DNA-binding transcriptional LysR family regulator